MGTSQDAVDLLPSGWSLAGWLIVYNSSVICISDFAQPTLNFQNSRNDVNAMSNVIQVNGMFETKYRKNKHNLAIGGHC